MRRNADRSCVGQDYEKGEALEERVDLGGDLLDVRLEVGDVEMAILGVLVCLVFIPST